MQWASTGGNVHLLRSVGRIRPAKRGSTPGVRITVGGGADVGVDTSAERLHLKEGDTLVYGPMSLDPAQ